MSSIILLCVMLNGPIPEASEEFAPASAWDVAVEARVAEIATLLNGANVADEKLLDALGELREFEPCNNSSWREIEIACRKLASRKPRFDGWSSVEGVAAHTLSRTCTHFPEAAEETLGALLIANRYASGPYSRCVVIEAIGNLPLKSATAAAELRNEANQFELVAGLTAESFYKIYAAAALVRVTPSEDERNQMIESLRSCLKDRRGYVRWLSADRLGTLGDDAVTATEDLRELLKDPNASVRASAAKAVWRISRDKSVLDQLVEVLRGDGSRYFAFPPTSTSFNDRSDIVVLEALGEIGVSNDAMLNAICDRLESPRFAYHFLALKLLLRLPLHAGISAATRERLRQVLCHDFGPSGSATYDIESMKTKMQIRLSVNEYASEPGLPKDER